MPSHNKTGRLYRALPDTCPSSHPPPQHEPDTRPRSIPPPPPLPRRGFLREASSSCQPATRSAPLCIHRIVSSHVGTKSCIEGGCVDIDERQVQERIPEYHRPSISPQAAPRRNNFPEGLERFNPVGTSLADSSRPKGFCSLGELDRPGRCLGSGVGVERV